jgi:FMN phosphatase YigB (HAD superfamily)
MTRLLILDFDGTFTDAHAEAEPFLAAFKRDLFDLLGRDASAEWDEQAADVRNHPQRYGWRIDGRISAPAVADPYLSASAIAQGLFDRFGILQNDDTRSQVLQTLYRKCYALTASVPRPDARAVLEDVLRRDLSVCIVTNSDTDTVQKKVDGLQLADAARLCVIGDARKFVLDAAPRDAIFDALEELVLPGLEHRTVITKRGHYYDLLRGLWADTSSSAETTLVCGDIFELDLALPLALGCRVHLVHRDETPPYEVGFVEAHALGSASRELSGVLEQLR